jgi:chitinase
MDYFIDEGTPKMLTMAPEFPHMRTNGWYEDLINGLEDYYTFIHPQYYNQAGDGIWDAEVWYVHANNNMVDFIVYLTKYITEGNGFVQVPADKLVIWLPATNWAAGSWYATSEQIIEAFQKMKAKGIIPKGLMTWSVNWDETNGWDFLNTYKKLYK